MSGLGFGAVALDTHFQGRVAIVTGAASGIGQALSGALARRGATLTLGLVRMQGEYTARWPVLMAASILILLPLVLVYAVAQRAFIRGIAVTGLGG